MDPSSSGPKGGLYYWLSKKKGKKKNRCYFVRFLVLLCFMTLSYNQIIYLDYVILCYKKREVNLCIFQLKAHMRVKTKSLKQDKWFVT